LEDAEGDQFAGSCRKRAQPPAEREQPD
jgi:hypothetical protein